MVGQQSGAFGSGEVENQQPPTGDGGKRASRFSYTKLKDYETCPYKLVLRKTIKTKSSPAMSFGTSVHREIEEFLKCAGELKSEMLESWAPALGELKAAKAMSEHLIEVARDWTPSKNAPWGVFILDALIVEPPKARIIDFKTGNPYPIAHGDQALFYACAVLSTREDVETVTAEMWYLKTGARAIYMLSRSGLELVRGRITERVTKMEGDEKLPPNPSKINCRWCQYQDDCEFSAV